MANRFLQRLSYSAPLLPLAMVQAPALSLLPSIYARTSGVDIALLGTILFATRLFDAVIDPTIGYLSDGTRSRFGARKPWIVLGAIVVSIGCWFWFSPPTSNGALWFLVWSLVVYLGWSLLEVPHSAWLADLTDDYDERSRLSGWRASAMIGGTLVFFAIPLLPIFSTTAVNGDTLPVIAGTAIALLLLTTVFSVGVTRQGRPRAMDEADRNPLKVLKAVWGNRPFRVLFASLLLGQVASGMVGALYVFYMDAYLHIADKVAFVAIGVSIISLISTQIWPLIMTKVGKHGALAIGAFGTAATLVVMAFLRPGPMAFPAMLGVFGLSSITAASITVAMYALMADVVDYDELRTGRNNAASYFSLATLINKIGIAVGGGVSLLIAGVFGFDIKGGNEGVAMAGFFTAFIVIPIVLNLTSVGLALRFPLTRRRQDVVSRRLAIRRARALRSAPS